MGDLFRKLIKKYQAVVSPILRQKGYHCLFEPTCSQYALICLRKYRLLKALPLIAHRLLSCNPVNAYLKHEQRS